MQVNNDKLQKDHKIMGWKFQQQNLITLRTETQGWGYKVN